MLYACELADLAWNFQCVRELDLLAKRAVGGDGDGVGRVGKAVGRRRWRGERWRWKGDGMEMSRGSTPIQARMGWWLCEDVRYRGSLNSPATNAPKQRTPTGVF